MKKFIVGLVFGLAFGGLLGYVVSKQYTHTSSEKIVKKIDHEADIPVLETYVLLTSEQVDQLMTDKKITIEDNIFNGSKGHKGTVYIASGDSYLPTDTSFIQLTEKSVETIKNGQEVKVVFFDKTGDSQFINVMMKK